ncbi:MAG: glycosyl hydrolase [Chthonomonadales bacterium]
MRVRTFHVFFFAFLGTTGISHSQLPTKWPMVTREMKPWTRWWWLGSAVDKQNLSRLLKEYNKVGLGGVEITPIYGVQGNDTNDIPYLSPKWMEMLNYTVSEAAKLGMGVDMPTGTGWPFGGPQVTDNVDGQDKHSVVVMPVTGAGTIILRQTLGKIEAISAVADDGETRVITESLGPNGNLPWSPPPGKKWTLYILRSRSSGMKVKRAAPGGEGRCINPFSIDSLNEYLARFHAALKDVPRGGIRSHFHDSFEYAADWSPELLKEFKIKRGYDLAEHLPALAMRGPKEEIARVRTDYRQTVAELLLENFTKPWSDWAHKQGSLSRNQAHGSPGNLLDLYGAVDIPETEVFRSTGDIRVSKLASSAAHVMGHKLVSSETGTWQSEHFTETLSDTKRIIDRLLVAGINHVFYHGTAYSPENAKWPGWLFYASTSFQPTHPIWHDFGALNEYVTRCQSILQSGSPDNDVLVYFPIHDIWMNQPGLFNFTIDGKWLEKEAVGEVASKLLKAGYSFDYVSDSQLLSARVSNGRIVTKGGEYRTIVVSNCNVIDKSTWNQLINLAQSGAMVVFEEGLPEKVIEFTTPGKGLSGTTTDGVSKPIRDGDLQVITTEKGKLVIGLNCVDVLDQLHVRHEVIGRNSNLRFIRRRTDAGIAYFILNTGDERFHGSLPLMSVGKSLVRMDPMTGSIERVSVQAIGSATLVDVQLDPGETVIYLVSNAANTDVPVFKPYISADGPLVLKNPWHVKFISGGPTLPAESTEGTLGSWTEWKGDEVKKFSGTAIYTTTFDTFRPGLTSAMLDLGKVCGSARVTVTGKFICTLLGPTYHTVLHNLKEHGNRLEIEVTNSAANRIRDMDIHREPWRIFKEINFVNIDYKPFDASKWPLRPSGLIGPVGMSPGK